MLIQQVGKTIREHDLIEKNQHIVLGLSGGPDSVCLFHVLMSLRAQMEITIHPVHLNHKFRPGEAERDQRYTEDLCDRMGVECRTFTVDCAAMARELSVTGEEAGRIARYDAFHETAEDIVSQLMARGLPDPSYSLRIIEILRASHRLYIQLHSSSISFVFPCMFIRSSSDIRTCLGLLPSDGPTICLSSIISIILAALLYPILNRLWSMETDAC